MFKTPLSRSFEIKTEVIQFSTESNEIYYLSLEYSPFDLTSYYSLLQGAMFNKTKSTPLQYLLIATKYHFFSSHDSYQKAEKARGHSLGLESSTIVNYSNEI